MELQDTSISFTFTSIYFVPFHKGEKKDRVYYYNRKVELLFIKDRIIVQVVDEGQKEFSEGEFSRIKNIVDIIYYKNYCIEELHPRISNIALAISEQGICQPYNKTFMKEVFYALFMGKDLYSNDLIPENSLMNKYFPEETVKYNTMMNFLTNPQENKQ